MRHTKSSFTRLDPAHLFDGAFVPVCGRPRGRLYVPPRWFSGSLISIQGFEQLGAYDQSVLLAISARVGINGSWIDPDPQQRGGISAQLVRGLEVEGNDHPGIATTRTSQRSLLIEAGAVDVDGGRAFDHLRAALNRLSNAQIREQGRFDRRYNMLYATADTRGDGVYLAVDPRLTAAIFNGQHVVVSLHERRALQSEEAQILHCWLCSYIRLGRALGRGNGARLDTLAPHVYGPGWAEASRKTRSIRRGRLRDALDEIADATASLHDGYGWKIDRDGSDLVLVARPKELPAIDQPAVLVDQPGPDEVVWGLERGPGQLPPDRVVTTPGQGGNNPRTGW